MVATRMCLLVAIFLLSSGESNAAEQVEQPTPGYLVFPVSTQARFDRDSRPDLNALDRPVSCSLAGGEFESIQIGVRASARGLTNVRLSLVTDLEATVYRRMEPDFELRWLNVYTHHQPLPPESMLLRSALIESIDADESANFWITFHADDETAPGLHIGSIRIQPEGETPTNIELQIRVRPFSLQRPRIAFGLYHCSYGYPDFARQPSQLEQVFQGMVDHGETAVAFYWGGDFSHVPPKGLLTDVMLPLAAKVGLVHPDIPSLILQGNLDGITTEERQKALAWLRGKQVEEGWPELVNYGWDEPAYPKEGLREKYAPLRTDPLRTGTALNAVGAYAYGDVHDVWILHDNEGTPELLAEAERTGAELWTYSYRIWRRGYSPLRQRFYAGIYTWARRFRGNMIWAYFDGRIHGQVWFPDEMSGPMPVVGWEGRREGIDDYRYIQMLEDAISAQPRSQVAIEAGAWLNALRVRAIRIDPLEIMPGKPISIPDYEEIREKAAAYIQELGVRPEAAAGVPATVSHLEDDAGRYRTVSVDSCIAALASPEPATRRGAAAALTERGAAAAPAARALAQVLVDPATRVPALRALEAMGPSAIPAIPAIAELLGHPDGFVRVAATVSLAGIVGLLEDPPDDGEGMSVDAHLADARRAAIPVLRVAMLDSYGPVADFAATALGRLGPDAVVALAEAIAVLEKPGWRERWAALSLIRGCDTGRAAIAIPAIARLYERSAGLAASAVTTLASFGPAAVETLPVIEAQADNPKNIYHETAYVALIEIRGADEDVEGLADILLLEQERRRNQKVAVVRELTRFADRAGPYVDRVRDLQAAGIFDEHEEVIDEFFAAIEAAAKEAAH